jgi:hypothetical protein
VGEAWYFGVSSPINFWLVARFCYGPTPICFCQFWYFFMETLTLFPMTEPNFSPIDPVQLPRLDQLDNLICPRCGYDLNVEN